LKNKSLQVCIALLICLFPGIGICQNTDLTCLKNGKIKIPSDSQNFRIENADYCYSLNPWMLLSQNCYPGSCRALQYFEVSKSDSSSAFGTSGSRLCVYAGGQAQTIFFETEKGNQKFNRCYFPEDSSFVDLGTLWSNHTKIDTRMPNSSSKKIKKQKK